ncbi:MAG TPA: DUF86 domain-containing protein [Planctomycetaceae bacterium]
MTLRWTNYLRHIIAECDFLRSVVTGVDRERFDGDPVLQRALVRSLEIIGEAATKLPTEVKNRSPDVPWKLIVGMRNRLIHGYFLIDYDVVWDVVQNEVPALRTKVEQMLVEAAAEEDEPSG